MSIKKIKIVNLLIGIFFILLSIYSLKRLYSNELLLSNSLKIFVASIKKIPFYNIEEKYFYIKISPTIIVLLIGILLVITSLFKVKNYKFILVVDIFSFFFTFYVFFLSLYVTISVERELLFFAILIISLVLCILLINVIKYFLKSEAIEESEKTKVSIIVFFLYAILILVLLILANYIYCILTLHDSGVLRL